MRVCNHFMMKRKTPANIRLGLCSKKEKARCALPFAPGFFMNGRQGISAAKLLYVVSVGSLSPDRMLSNGCAIILLDARKAESLLAVENFFILLRMGKPTVSVNRHTKSGIRINITRLLLQDRMKTAVAVIGGGFVTPPVVVIEHKMLALVPDNVGNAFEILGVLSYYE